MTHEEHQNNFIAKELERYHSHTLMFAPHMPNPLPGEREAREAGRPWTIYEVLAEIEGLKPAVKAARKAWISRRRADMPGHLREFQAARWAEADARLGTDADLPRAPRHRDSAKARNGKLAHLTPAEKRERKLEQARRSNARRREERKAAQEAGTASPGRGLRTRHTYSVAQGSRLTL